MSFVGPAHKYALGARVKLAHSLRGAAVEGSVYEVTRQLPAEHNEFQYRLRSLDGRLERVTLESQLIQAPKALGVL